MLDQIFLEFQLLIVGATSDGINNRVDQVIHLAPLFISSGLKFAITFSFLSNLGRNLETKVYVGYRSSGRIYTYLYAIVCKKNSV
jgi:hypothetical protein